jgi:ATP-dependent protease ClpP protease subunit
VIHLHINSPGGDVFDGIAMANAIAKHPSRIVAHIDGLAASAASIVAVAGHEVRMEANALLMIHKAWTVGIGDANTFLKTAEVLTKIDESLVSSYVQASGQSPEQIRTWMTEETWFSAEEAVDAGFVDSIDNADPEEQKQVEDALAEFDLSVFSHTPDRLIAARRSEPTKRDAERALRDAGFSRREAKAVAALVKQEAPRDVVPDGAAEVLAAGARLLHTLTQ